MNSWKLHVANEVSVKFDHDSLAKLGIYEKIIAEIDGKFRDKTNQLPFIKQYTSDRIKELKWEQQSDFLYLGGIISGILFLIFMFVSMYDELKFP